MGAGRLAAGRGDAQDDCGYVSSAGGRPADGKRRAGGAWRRAAGRAAKPEGAGCGAVGLDRLDRCGARVLLFAVYGRKNDLDGVRLGGSGVLPRHCVVHSALGRAKNAVCLFVRAGLVDFDQFLFPVSQI